MVERNTKKIDEIIVSISLLFLFWMIITLPSHPISILGLRNIVEHILIGLIFSSIITIIMPYPLITTFEIKKYFHLKIFLKFIAYIFNLIIEIILAGIDVAYRVLGPNILISPGIVIIDTPLTDDLEISLNANSITLTPGTITMDIEKKEKGSRFYIHCISNESIKNILVTGGFINQIQNIVDKT
ncbi:MAG: Na+/H+ antiporter subunit E [bacterium]